MTAETPHGAATSRPAGAAPPGGDAWEDVERTSLPSEQAAQLRSAIGDSPQFDSLVTVLRADHDVGAVDVDDASSWRLVHDDGAERLLLEWTDRDLTVRAYAERPDARRPRVVATVEGVDPDSGDSQIDIEPLGDAVTVRYYADDSTVIRGETTREQVVVGVHVAGRDQLDTITSQVLEERERSDVDPEAEITVNTDTPITGEPTELSAVGSRAIGPAPIVRYEWIFDLDHLDDPLDGPREGAVREVGANNREIVHDPLQLQTTHTYRNAGSYEVGLIVEDADGNRALATDYVHVNPPSARESDVEIDPDFEVEVVDEDERRFRFWDRSESSEDHPIAHRDWFVEDDAQSGPVVSHQFEEGGVHRVSLTVTTANGFRDTTSKTILLGGPDEVPEDPSVTASLGCITDVAFGDGSVQELTNADVPPSENFPMPSYGPQVVDPDSRLAFTARDSVLPPIHGDVRCTWTVKQVSYGIPNGNLLDLTERREQEFGDRSHHDDPLTPGNGATPYDHLTMRSQHPLTTPEIPAVQRDRSVTGIDETYSHRFPADPSGWTFSYDRLDVQVRRPAFLVRVEVEVQGIPDTEEDWTVESLAPTTVVIITTEESRVTTTETHTAEMMVYLDVAEDADEVDEIEEGTLQGRADRESHRWATGRPAVPGYVHDRTFEPDSSRVRHAHGPVLVPTATETVDYLYFTGPHLGSPGNYQGEIEGTVDVQWLTFEPVDWGPPGPDHRVFVPVGVRR